MNANGYVALVVGSKPKYYRVLFFPTLLACRDRVAALKKEADPYRKIEVFKMVDGDTLFMDEDLLGDRDEDIKPLS